MKPASLCPLCGSKDVCSFCEDKKRTYLKCSYCMLVFVPKRYWLSFEEEKAEYDLHQNNARDLGYRRFLSRLCTPLLEKLDSKQKGLDFGCGPGPALSVLFKNQGHLMDLYDPIYHNDLSVFSNHYDFICATEVVEHLREPHKDFTALFAMLNRSGWLGIMTKRVIDESAFRQWHYIRDRTHICFYCRDTFEYLAQRFNANASFVASDVILFQKR